MTFGWGFLIGVLSTISVIGVGTVVAAVLVQLQQRKHIREDAAAERERRAQRDPRIFTSEPPLG